MAGVLRSRIEKPPVNVCLLLGLLAVFLYNAQALSARVQASPPYKPRFLPFDRGEEASYIASWNGIPVATATIHTQPHWVGEKKFFKVRVQARTLKWMDAFWKMRDTIVSIFEADTLGPYRYSIRQRENRRTVDTEASFDREGNRWVVQRKTGSKVRQYTVASSNTLDPITAAYMARSVDFKVGDQLHLDVFGGKSRYQVTLDVVSREKVRLESETFEAFKIHPRVKNVTKAGHAGKLRQATVWISADERRLPLMVKSEVFVGSVYLKMVEPDRRSALPAGSQE